jgi:putative transposase
MAHYHTERNHQGLANQLLQPDLLTEPFRPMQRRQRLGGMLNCYRRAA